MDVESRLVIQNRRQLSGDLRLDLGQAVVHRAREIGLLQQEAPVAWAQLAIGVTVSAIVAYLAIEFFMRFVSRIGLLPFALYRFALVGIILYVLA